ncbi:hypothetical protein [Pontibacter beigongshangensis]|uniref:hypothetical protein n=1 Tax=Pontibacter beigongshangensis TaxID=2574733 RepID=UPI001650798E|nr:hypothetical protein [Pontibacter beigongshangensis]
MATTYKITAKNGYQEDGLTIEQVNSLKKNNPHITVEESKSNIKTAKAPEEVKEGKK